ncbi:MAG: tRNA (5-methylaminomethyl-2-thiouridine)(34)-methyltransferase MnmD [Flavobacteriia bacterium]|nr:tRNA (5-methylaminomethyl-2-thiouridine)(34)-methyltransferase MnmD [Flavobacteriia bacterium]OJX36113.1 MAG: hypothetical protein BGO87_06510 [Flavobacteriia bacterium 40-80]
MQKNREIITTADGSKTIFFPDINENYHSHHGALQEARHVFFKNGLDHFSGRNELTVFEVGFGTGLNTLLAIEYAEHHRKKITYHSIEAFPVSLEEAGALDYGSLTGNPSLKTWATDLHLLSWNEEHRLTDHFRLKKLLSKLEDYSLETAFYDCIFFDAFGPRVQSEMWAPEILKKMYEGLKKEGLLVTYCAKGQVKRDLKSAGFRVEAAPGPPGKREMTLAWK